MDNRILAHRGWRMTDGLVGSFEMLRAEQGLRDACSCGDRESLKEIANSLSVEKLDQVLSNGKDYPTGTPLFEAILCEQDDILQDLIHLGCDLEQECALDIFFPVHFVDTGSALCVACAIGNVQCVSILLEAGASVNHAGKFTTPLMSACQDGNPHIIDLLLEAGADVNLSPRCNKGQTALHVSSLLHDCVDNMRMLVAYGGDVNQRDHEGHSPAFKACMGYNCDVAEFLLQHDLLDSSVQEKIHMFWLLGAECAIGLANPELATKYWKWAAVMDPNFEEYRRMLDSKLTKTQRNACIHQLGDEADLNRLSTDRQRVQLQALVFFYLVLGWGKGTVSCLTGLMNAALVQQKAWLTSQLLVFSENMADQVSSYDMGSVCENISQTVEDLLEMYLVQSLHPAHHPPPPQLNLILQAILSHILQLLEKLVRAPDLAANRNVLKLSHLQCSQIRSKRDQAVQLIEAFLGMHKYGLHGPGKIPAMRDTYIEKLQHFCDLCQLPSSVAVRLSSTVWQIAVYGGPCCHHSLVWQHHHIFPCVHTTKLLIKCGLDINCVDDKRDTPLHHSLLCQEPAHDIVRLLVENGAEIDLPNKEGVRPYDIFVKKPGYSINVVEFSSLKSLATRAIVKHKLPYSKVLPKSLVEFVEARHVHIPCHGLWKVKAQ